MPLNAEDREDVAEDVGPGHTSLLRDGAINVRDDQLVTPVVQVYLDVDRILHALADLEVQCAFVGAWLQTQPLQHGGGRLEGVDEPR